MKKTISTVFVVIFLLSMGAAAFAAEQTITVTVPGRTYTMTIPATTDITYGQTDVVASENELKITSSNPTLLFSNGHYVQVNVSYGNLRHEDSAAYTLPLSILRAKPADATNVQGGYGGAYTWESLASGASVKFTGTTDFYWTNGYRLGAQVTSWDKAEPGEYQATVTYTAEVKS